MWQMSEKKLMMCEELPAILSGSGVPALCLLCGSDQVTELLEAPDRFHLRKEEYRLLRCLSCTGVWVADPPPPVEMGIHYTRDYHKAIMASGEGSIASRWRFARTRIARYKQGGAVLDIGCSSGAFLCTMKGPSWELYGIEMEESTAEKARATTGARIFAGDAIAAPFLPASFDVITSFDVLEHVYSPRQFLAKVFEWLKPGGIYYATMPNIDSWEARMFGSYWYGLELPRHLSHFSPHSLRHLMNTLGFEEVVVATPPTSYLERSLGYVSSTILESLGFSATPQSNPKPRSLPWRALRKLFRMGLVTPLAQVASLACIGPSMEVVFRKPGHHHTSESPIGR